MSALTGNIVAELSTTAGNVVIRYLRDGDAPAMLEFINALSREQTFILFQGEQPTLDQEESWLHGRLAEIENGSGVSLGAFLKDRAIGSTAVTLKPLAERHVGVFGLSVSQALRGLGIGGALIDAAIAESTTHLDGLRIIELSVMSPNDGARKLYASRGFTEHGVLPGGVRFRGSFVDHVLMHLTVEH